MRAYRLRPSSKKKMVSKQKELAQTRAFESMRTAAQRMQKAQDMKPKPWGTVRASYAAVARGQRSRNHVDYSSSNSSSNSSSKNSSSNGSSSISSTSSNNSDSISKSGGAISDGGSKTRAARSIGRIKTDSTTATRKSLKHRSRKAKSFTTPTLPSVSVIVPLGGSPTAAAAAASAAAGVMATLKTAAAKLLRGKQPAAPKATSKAPLKAAPTALRLKMKIAKAGESTGFEEGGSNRNTALATGNADAATPTPTRPLPGFPAATAASGTHAAAEAEAEAEAEAGERVPPVPPADVDSVFHDLPLLAMRSGYVQIFPQLKPEGHGAMHSPEDEDARTAARATRSRSAVYQEILNEATRVYFKPRSTADLSSSVLDSNVKLPMHLLPQEATINETKFPPIRVVHGPSSGSSSPSPPPPPNGNRKKRSPSPYSAPFVMPSA